MFFTHISHQVNLDSQTSITIKCCPTILSYLIAYKTEDCSVGLCILERSGGEWPGCLCLSLLGLSIQAGDLMWPIVSNEEVCHMLWVCVT